MHFSAFLAPYLYLFSAVVQIMHFLGAILDDFNEQDEHQSTKKSAIINVRLALFFMLIRYRFNVHFSWVILSE